MVFRGLPLAAQIGLFGKIFSSSFRRFLYRIRGIREYYPLDFGVALQRRPDGSYQPNTRTAFRSESIDKLLAKYPWADIEDARMFLEGFDAGGQWTLENRPEGYCQTFKAREWAEISNEELPVCDHLEGECSESEGTHVKLQLISGGGFSFVEDGK